MSTITLRSTKGSALTNAEVDANFTNLNTDKLELGGTYASGTASAVPYLNASKALTTGSALTFNGTTLTLYSGAGVGLTIYETASGNNNRLILSQTAGITTYNATYGNGSVNAHVFQIGGGEYMRLTSAGLGVGTSSPFARLAIEKTGGDLLTFRYNSSNPRAGLYVGGTSGSPFFGSNLVYSAGNVFNYDVTGVAWFIGSPAGSANFGIKVGTGTAGTSFGTDTGAYSLTIDTSGKLGIGTSTPTTYIDAGSKSIRAADSTKFVADYSVAASTYVPITLVDGSQTLTAGYQYRVKLVTTGTGTSTGAVYVINQTGGATWVANVVSNNGLTSNNPLLRVNGTAVEIYQSHTATYNVRAFVESWYTGNITLTANTFFGVESALTNYGGYVGVGKSTPNSRLDVNGDITMSSNGTVMGMLFNNSSLVDLQAGSNTTGLRVGTSAASPLILYTNGTERMRIDSAGNLGLGTSAPAAILDMQRASTGAILGRLWNTDTSGTGSAVFRIANSGNNTLGGQLQFSDAAYYTGTIASDRTNGMVFYVGTQGSATTSERMRIDINGSVLVNTTSNSVAGVSGKVVSSGAIIAYTGVAGAPTMLVSANSGNQAVDRGAAIDIVSPGTGLAVSGARTTGRITSASISASTQGGYLSFSTENTSGTVTEGMRIDTGGNLLVGTVNSNAKLYVVGTASATGYTTIFGSGTAYQDVAGYGNADVGNGVWNWQPATVPGSGTAQYYTYFRSRTSVGTTQHNVLVDGNVGIGTTTPSQKLTVNGNVNLTGANSYFMTANSSYFGAGNSLVSAGGTSDTGILTAGNILFATNAGAGNTERMRIDSSGRVTTPYQPYAWVRFAMTTSGGAWQKITGSVVVTDLYSNWSTANNRFTAPVAGRYMFIAGGYSVTGGSGSERYALGVAKNASLLQFNGANMSASDTPVCCSVFVLDLAANDYLELQMYTAAAMGFNNSSNHSLYAQVYLIG